MRRRSLFLYIVSLALVPALLPAASSLLDDLSVSDRDGIRNGKQILITENMDGKPWPRVKVYRTIKASPEEVIAVFCDYSNAKKYVPNVLKSDISKQVNPHICEVDYGINVPILPDEYYTVRNSVKILGKDQYQVDWKLLRAIQTKDSEGFLRVEPFEGGSVIMYQNLVTPGSSMAGLLRGKAIEQMRETVTAISAHVEKKKTTAPAELQKNVQSFRGMISGTSKTP